MCRWAVRGGSTIVIRGLGLCSEGEGEGEGEADIAATATEGEGECCSASHSFIEVIGVEVIRYLDKGQCREYTDFNKLS